MALIRKYLPFFASAGLLYLLLVLVYPFYQYYVDPDATAYLTIAKRYAGGDYVSAINGYWSPWGCWLTALLLKAGLLAIPAAIIINSFGALGFLFISHSFFLKFNVESKWQWLFCFTLALFLVYAVFWQSFDDLWECFFLLSCLRIMLSHRFTKNPSLWIVYGFMGTLAYFAKAYSFPFFILNTLICGYFLAYGNKTLWIKICFISIAIMVSGSFPWINLLHLKYGLWTTSTAGTLNTSWYLIGHPHWKEGIGLLIPPAFKDSPWYWEDPWMANGDTPHFWNSLSLFGLQFLRAAYNCVKFTATIFQLSIFFPIILLVAIKTAYKKTGKLLFSDPFQILILSFLLFPLAYFLINFESRYLWYMLPLSMVIGAVILQKGEANFLIIGPGSILGPASLNKEDQRKRTRSFKIPNVLIFVLFPLSFLVYPFWGMKTMFNEGNAEYRLAQQLKASNIHGTFTSITKPGLSKQRAERLAYFSGNPYFSIPRQDVQFHDILKETRSYHVNYFFSFRNDGTEGGITDEEGKPFPVVFIDKDNSLKVYQLNK